MTKKNLSDSDSELFRNSVGSVKAIKSDKVHLQTQSKPVFRPKSITLPDDAPLSDIIDEDLETLGLEDTFSYLSPGLQKNVLRKLRRGYFGVEAELDLHGLTTQAAKQQLIRFLNFCTQNGYRSVHIIHGKGYRSQDQHPVLKNHLNNWLRQHPDVLGFCSAAIKDGGAGALRLLLHISEKF